MSNMYQGWPQLLACIASWPSPYTIVVLKVYRKKKKMFILFCIPGSINLTSLPSQSVAVAEQFSPCLYYMGGECINTEYSSWFG